MPKEITKKEKSDKNVLSKREEEENVTSTKQDKKSDDIMGTSNVKLIINKKDENQNLSEFDRSKDSDLPKLPNSADAEVEEKENLFIQKIKQCAIVFEFVAKPIMNVKGKEIKIAALNEIINFVNTADGQLSESVYKEIVNMFVANVFRILPIPTNLIGMINYKDEDKPFREPSWPHLQLVYQFFLICLNSPYFHPNFTKKYIDQKFIILLLNLFDSEDPDERAILTEILHKIYVKVTDLRQHIRKHMNNIFYKFMYETGHHNGIDELLEIYGSIIRGFAVPLKKEHVVFLQKVLIPLHKMSLKPYHTHLVYCVIQFIIKDMTLIQMIIFGLLRYWPKSSSVKEIMFLNEIEELLYFINHGEFKKLIGPLFSKLAECVSSSHCQVAERALCFLNNNDLLPFISANMPQIFPIMFPGLYSSTEHWNNIVQPLVLSSLQLFTEMDRKSFNKRTIDYIVQQQRDKEAKKKRKLEWDNLDKIAHNLTHSATNRIKEVVDMDYDSESSSNNYTIVRESNTTDDSHDGDVVTEMKKVPLQSSVNNNNNTTITKIRKSILPTKKDVSNVLEQYQKTVKPLITSIDEDNE